MVEDGSLDGKKVMVTGGAGFLGSHLVEELLSKGCEVWSVDNYLSGLPENFKKVKGDDKLHLLEADISKPLSFEGELDFIFHFASIADPKLYLKFPIETLRANTFGTYHLLELAKKKGASFLFASTSEIYGDAEILPTPESYWGNVNPTGPRSCYDESKRCGEAFCMAYLRQHGMDIKIVRIFNTYGPRLRDGRAVPEFIKSALKNDTIHVDGDGSQTRSFCYVSDLIDGVLLLAEKGEPGEPVNIGNDAEITILELAETVIEIANSKSEIEFSPRPTDDPERRRPDISKAREMLGWSPDVSLEEGLRMTVDWFREST